MSEVSNIGDMQQKIRQNKEEMKRKQEEEKKNFIEELKKLSKEELSGIQSAIKQMSMSEMEKYAKKLIVKTEEYMKMVETKTQEAIERQKKAEERAVAAEEGIAAAKEETRKLLEEMKKDISESRQLIKLFSKKWLVYLMGLIVIAPTPVIVLTRWSEYQIDRAMEARERIKALNDIGVMAVRDKEGKKYLVLPKGQTTEEYGVNTEGQEVYIVRKKGLLE